MKTLLLIDIQNDFLPGGSLAIPQGDKIIPIVNELMPHYELIVASQDWHPENHGSFAANHSGSQVGEMISVSGHDQILWPVHCVEGSEGASFSKHLATGRIDHIIRKGEDPLVDSYSAFFDNGHRNATGMTSLLNSKGVTELHIAGLATDYCVKFTALDALDEGFTVCLIEDACRGVNVQEGDVNQALELLEAKGVKLVHSAELLSDTVTLYRPIGPEELVKLEESGFTAWPPRLPDQPIFYPVMNQNYAEQIATEWNVRDSGSGSVTRFEVKRLFLKQYSREVVGGREHEELWIPAKALAELNANIVGKIEVIKRFEKQTAS